MKQYLLYVLPFVGLHHHVAFAETETVSLGSGVGWEWDVTGPCLDGGNAFATKHTICFKSNSDNVETFALTFDLGDTPVELPGFPIQPGGSTCTSKLFEEAGEYKCELTATVDGQTETSSFDNPWNIDASGNCVAGSVQGNSESGDPKVDQVKEADTQEKSGAAAGSRYVEILLVSIFSLVGAYVMC